MGTYKNTITGVQKQFAKNGSGIFFVCPHHEFLWARLGLLSRILSPTLSKNEKEPVLYGCFFLHPTNFSMHPLFLEKTVLPFLKMIFGLFFLEYF